MRVLRTAADLRTVIASWRTEALRIAFVPTMGALHEGHLSLVRLAREHADRVVVSIFVNPTQFNNADDLARYPRTPERDAALLESAGCDLLFLPAVETIYPLGSSTRIEIFGPPALGLEGDFRPGHFRGVATVVAILFNLVTPDVAIFGEKDAQQLALVQRLVRDLALPIEIIPGPTLREPNGLAMSSRNTHLSAEERRRAAVLYRALIAARERIEAGERNAHALRAQLRAVIASEPGVELEYADAVDAETFEPLAELRGAIVIPLAARVGTTRLIDNLRLRIEA